jgi:DNA-binding GntR family transcriptional regulator
MEPRGAREGDGAMNEAVSMSGVRERGSAGPVFATLRQEIISLALAPGTVLSRAALQARFGLSSTPIRDGLMRLAEEGLVEIFPQHATIVSPIDLGLAQQGQFLRRSVEMEIARVLAQAPDAVLLEALHRLIRRQAAFADLDDHAAFAEADHAFHRTMYEAAGVAGLWHLVRRQGGHIDRLRRLHLPVAGKMRAILRDHEAIVAAIAAGRPARAQESVRAHLSQSLDAVDALRARHPAYFRHRPAAPRDEFQGCQAAPDPLDDGSTDGGTALRARRP